MLNDVRCIDGLIVKRIWHFFPKKATKVIVGSNPAEATNDENQTRRRLYYTMQCVTVCLMTVSVVVERHGEES